MIADVVRMASVVEIRRERRVPLRGNITVNLGDPVNPEDVVVETSIPSQVLSLDIARGLGVPVSESAACLIREIGEDVAEGDIIAQCDNAFPRFVRAPVDGKIIECREGKVILATGETMVRVQAGMTGIVADLIPEFGVVITTRGRLIQGVWGNGRMGTGNISVVEDSWESPLNKDMLEPATETPILCAGVCLDASVLTELAAAGISGLVLCALAPELTQMASELPFPLVVIQGFGELPADLSVRNFFQSSEGLSASLNACVPDLSEGCRPEVVIPQDAGDPSPEMAFRENLASGQQVRVLSGIALGQQGEVVELSEDKKQFESGLALFAATIRMQDGKIVTVAQQNLVIIG